MGGSSRPKYNMVETTTRETKDPWAPTVPGLTEAIEESKRLREDLPEWFPGQTYTDFDPAQLQGLNRMQARALAGSPQIAAAQNLNLDIMQGNLSNPIIEQMQETARGDFLTGDTNPYTQAVIDEILANAAGIASTSGRLGSGYATGAATTAIAPILAGQFDAERNRQERARESLAHIYQADRAARAGAGDRAGGLALLDYQDPEILTQVGGAFRTQADLEKEAAIQEFNFLQNRDKNAFDRYLQQMLSLGGQGGTRTLTQQIPMMRRGGSSGFNRGMQIAGMGLNVAGMMGMCDHRLKDNIEDLPNGALDTVLQLKPKRYNYRAEYGFDSSTTEGFLAHEVQGVLPDAVTGTYNGVEPQLVDVLSILATVTKAMQELCVKVDRLEKRLET